MFVVRVEQEQGVVLVLISCLVDWSSNTGLLNLLTFPLCVSSSLGGFVFTKKGQYFPQCISSSGSRKNRLCTGFSCLSVNLVRLSGPAWICDTLALIKKRKEILKYCDKHQFTKICTLIEIENNNNI